MSDSITDIIKNRRTIHHFVAEPRPTTQLLENALQAAVCAPNHHLTRPWQFHLIGPASAERICRLNADLVEQSKGAKAAEVKLKRWREIPGWLLLSCTRSAEEQKQREDYAACCCVAQNLALILWEQGIGMKWTTGKVTRDARFFDIVQVDRRERSIVGLFCYGYPGEIPKATRQPLAECLHVLP